MPLAAQPECQFALPRNGLGVRGWTLSSGPKPQRTRSSDSEVTLGSVTSMSQSWLPPSMAGLLVGQVLYGWLDIRLGVPVNLGTPLLPDFLSTSGVFTNG